MTKRDRFIADLREEAARLGLQSKVSKGRGKGSHAILWVGDKWTTIPNRDVDPKTAKKIRKGLGL